MQQRDDLIRGRLSAQELMEQLGLVPAEAATEDPAASEASAAEDPASASAQNPASSAQAPASSAEPVAPADPADRAQALIEDCVRRLYVLEVDLLSQLGSFRQDAINEWNALDKSERTSSRKISIALDGLDRCEELERQSDADVRALLDACRSELEALGASTEIIDELWNSYAEEKETTKTYFLSQYA
jgi:predicted lipid-binding transport protein (Tim44 family)